MVLWAATQDSVLDSPSNAPDRLENTLNWFEWSAVFRTMEVVELLASLTSGWRRESPCCPSWRTTSLCCPATSGRSPRGERQKLQGEIQPRRALCLPLRSWWQGQQAPDTKISPLINSRQHCPLPPLSPPDLQNFGLEISSYTIHIHEA